MVVTPFTVCDAEVMTPTVTGVVVMMPFPKFTVVEYLL